MSEPLNVNQDAFAREVLQSSTPVLVDFWAEWCMPCRAVAPVVKKLADAYAGKLKVAKVDTDANPSLAAQYGVTSIPCLILFKSGEPVDQVIGYVPEKTLAAMVNKHVNPAAVQS